MKLKEWMDRNKINSTELSKRIGCSKNTIDKARIGYAIGRKTAEKIVKFTRGEVSFSEIWNGDEIYPFISIYLTDIADITIWDSDQKNRSFQMEPEFELVSFLFEKSKFKYLVINNSLRGKRYIFKTLAHEHGTEIVELPASEITTSRELGRRFIEQSRRI